ncbi:hypothetical protein EJ06DRAFT_123968 [Trichodelitschia bisporula]|uniref:Uncharacterized protein n=1 Tax=Trichodelitschia bisporula TaxID=703511 RepID=A0A6G1HQH7_9PEZI|nr:hypothetical protein EJ06DRAFT_123968 [Trichodelitschia bisporula]
MRRNTSSSLRAAIRALSELARPWLGPRIQLVLPFLASCWICAGHGSSRSVPCARGERWTSARRSLSFADHTHAQALRPAPQDVACRLHPGAGRPAIQQAISSEVKNPGTDFRIGHWLQPSARSR